MRGQTRQPAPEDWQKENAMDNTQTAEMQGLDMPERTYRRSREELLVDAATKPIMHMVQFDVIQHAVSDSVLHADEDGDALLSSRRDDLARFTGVRVRFPTGYDRADALRALQKVILWLEDDAHLGSPMPEITTDEGPYQILLKTVAGLRSRRGHD